MKLRKLLIALILAVTVLGSQASAADKKSTEYKDVYSGEVTTLNYLISASENEHRMFANMLDGLVEYDQFGVLKPSLATSWTVSPDGLSWTFKLRPGVVWVTSAGKEYGEVVADDWVAAAKYILTKANASQTASNMYDLVKGAKDYYDGKASDFAQVGVKALDKATLQYTLARPVPYFLSVLTYVTFLPVSGKFLAEQGTRFGADNKSVLYNGGYVMRDFEAQVGRDLVRNERYWDKSRILISRLSYKYNKESLTLEPELYLRGEITGTTDGIPAAVLDSWMKDPAKKAQIHPDRTNSYSYFYALNFDPKMAPEYEPDNWKVVVNNKAFRKALFHAFDRKAAMLTSEPYNPDRRLQSTITPRNFTSAGGKDYVDIGELASFSKAESFDKAKAASFKAQALKELSGKASFPVKVMMPFRADMSDWANRAQVVEQQLETVLGKDFIDIIPVSFPATGFLGATRRPGNYAIQEVNWGPDYADPETYTDPFVPGSNYNKPFLALGYEESNGKGRYENLVNAAKAETTDQAKRYALFAKAEAFLIGEAFVIPYARGGGGYVATRLESFTAPFAPFGLSYLKFKGQAILAKPLSTEEYAALEKKWQEARDKALGKTK